MFLVAICIAIAGVIAMLMGEFFSRRQGIGWIEATQWETAGWLILVICNVIACTLIVLAWVQQGVLA